MVIFGCIPVKYDHIHPERGGWLMLVACCGAYDWTKKAAELWGSHEVVQVGGEGEVGQLLLVKAKALRRTGITSIPIHCLYKSVLGRLEVCSSLFDLWISVILHLAGDLQKDVLNSLRLWLATGPRPALRPLVMIDMCILYVYMYIYFDIYIIYIYIYNTL